MHGRAKKERGRKEEKERTDEEGEKEGRKKERGGRREKKRKTREGGREGPKS